MSMSTTTRGSFKEPRPIGWTNAVVQKFASDAAKKLGYRPGDDIEAVVERLGGKITVADRNSKHDTGAIQVRGKNDFLIALSPLTAHRRSRFTIVHEVGHYMLHSQMGRIPIQVRRDASGRVEWEANWFAAGFLMPEEEFKAKRADGWGDAELAEHFGVSIAAVVIRKESVG